MNLFDVYTIFDIEPVRAEGSRLWDAAGREYLDLYGGHAVISIGHSHPHYVAALTRQLNAIGFYSNSVQIPAQKRLAEHLGRLSGYSDYQLFLCNSGAEANENAFKLASFHNGRTKIVAFTGAFHGRTSLAVAVTDNPAIVSPANATADTALLPLNDFEALYTGIDHTVAAVVVEGIQGVAGIREPEARWLQALQQRCKETGALLIVDEVQSGYGRSGRFFAHQYAGIRPDIITVAKGMGNGFPVAGVLIAPGIKGRKEILGTTFGGNYLACAAALSVLEVIEQEDLIIRAEAMGQWLLPRLAAIPHIREVRGKGLMIGLQLDAPCGPVRRWLLEEHGIFTGSAKQPDTIRLLPALTVEKQALQRFLTALEEGLKGAIKGFDREKIAAA